MALALFFFEGKKWLFPDTKSLDSIMSRKPLILIADDEASVREALRLFLKEEYDLLLAEDGEKALELVQKQPPDLIIMDIGMPKLNGWGAMKEIRNQGHSMPIIVITGFPQSSDKSALQKLGVKDYLVKPFSLFQLRELIRKEVTR